MKKILVTGGAGFVGHHLVNRLIEKGYDVTVFDDLSSGLIDRIHPRSKFVQGDIRDLSTLNLAMNQSTSIIWSAYRISSRIR